MEEITRELHNELVKYVDSEVHGQYNKGILHVYLMMMDHIHIQKQPVGLEGFRELLDGLGLPGPDALKQ